MPDYSGIVATTYDLLVTNDAIGDAGYFRDIIRDHGEPALQIWCGTGRLLLDCVAEGLEVEGVDSSPEMLQICRHKAEQRGLTVAVHPQAMQRLELARRFRTLFVPAGSFMLLLDPADAEQALARFRAHLAPGGQVLVALEQPAEAPEADGVNGDAGWTLRRQAVRRDDGATIECWEHVRDDPGRQLRASTIRPSRRLGGPAARPVSVPGPPLRHQAPQAGDRPRRRSSGCSRRRRRASCRAASRPARSARPPALPARPGSGRSTGRLG